ncbi:MAG: selenium cofactor biosynthesis protein YqeC [Terrisporobacter sp.]
MNLIHAFEIKNKDIITIVGAGGKTSLMFSASSLLRIDFKVLVTTTTHIYVPDDKLYDEMIMLSDFENNKISNKDENLNENNEDKSFNEKYNKEKLDYIFRDNKRGIYLVGNNIINNCKIKGLTFEQLDKVIPYFDIVIIEGDGSKEKCIKGWNDSEPVIYPKTTKTIGVVDITSVGLDINEDNIHRLDRFLEIIKNDSHNKVYDSAENFKYSLCDKVNINHLKNMILNKNGLFKVSRGERILFINKVENINNKKNSLKLIESIKDKWSFNVDSFIYGSVREKEFIKVE